VGILYNNVGVSYDHAELLQELSDEKIQVNPSFLFLFVIQYFILILFLLFQELSDQKIQVNPKP